MTDKFQFVQYKNIRKAFLNPEYRALETSDPELKYEEFSKLLLAQKYILLKCKYPNNFRRESYRGRMALIVLTRYDSEYHNRSKEFISLLDKLSAQPEVKSSSESDLFLVTNQLLKKRTIKKVRNYRHFVFNNILSVRFAVELPKANLCCRHEITTIEEIKKLSEECYIRVDKDKYIAEDDAQNIWIGGFPGELVKITKPSQMAGYAINYRYITGVIPRVDTSNEAEADADDDDDAKDDD